MEWTRSSHDTTVIHCAGDDQTFEIWYETVVSLIESMERTMQFRIHDNGYRKFHGVFVSEGVKGTYNGHDFSIWSDIPGEIILRHPEVPRSAVELLCSRVKECWLSLSGV
jgi:hypothetical protein